MRFLVYKNLLRSETVLLKPHVERRMLKERIKECLQT